MYNNEFEKNDLIDRYIQNKLSAEDSDEFEILMFNDIELFEDVKLAQAFQHSLVLEKKSIDASKQTNKNFAVTLSHWFKQPLSMAASFLVAFSLFFSYGNQQSSIRPNDILPITTMIPLEQTRGNSTDTVSINAEQFPLLFQIDVGFNFPNREFQLSMKNSNDTQAVYSEFNSVSDDNGWVRFVINDKNLENFLLSIESTGNNDTQYMKEYTIEVIH